MRIIFERTGGFAGMRLAAEVQTEVLAPEEADELTKLVESSCFFDLPASLITSDGSPDQFLYRLVITNGELEHTIETSETAAPNALLPLLEHLTRLARSKKK
jgi:hypothetical protein